VHTISRNKKGNIALQAASQINMYASGERERRRERERERGGEIFYAIGALSCCDCGMRSLPI